MPFFLSEPELFFQALHLQNWFCGKFQNPCGAQLISSSTDWLMWLLGNVCFDLTMKTAKAITDIGAHLSQLIGFYHPKS